MSKSVGRCSIFSLAVIATLFSLISAPAASAEELTNIFLKGPYLQGPGADKIIIKWESPNNTPSLVRYGLNGKLDSEFLAQNPRPLDVGGSLSTNSNSTGETNITRETTKVYLYEVALTNLKPNSVYTYQAESAGVKTPPKTFRTF